MPVVVLALLVLSGIGFWHWASHASEPAQASEVNPVRSTLHLETFVLNLADSDQRSYLRVGVDLALNQDAKRAEETVPIAEVRDTILGVLGEARVDDLTTAAGKAKLKKEIVHALVERMPQLGAEDVYFTEFLVQR